mmetsp:Transcript_104679/g.225867  ORF Transcript_104679/g.225867 Transcript_104679/m.225867 type:complete len:547 (-) Transcript_104679:6-1646(-)
MIVVACFMAFLARSRFTQTISFVALELQIIFVICWILVYGWMIYVVHPMYSEEMRDYHTRLYWPRSEVAYTVWNHLNITAMGIATIMCTSHSCLLIRWSVLVSMDVSFFVSYAALFFASGASDVFIPALCVGMVVLSSLGHRSHELVARQLFLTIVDERTLRAEAQFQRENDIAGGQRTNNERYEESDRASAATTTVTNQIFRHLNEGNLKWATELGIQEQWLLKSEEVVEFESTVLGHGAFSVVLGGTFCRTPVALKRCKFTEKPSVKSAGALEIKDMIESIWNELRILRHLRHPHIANFHGAVVGTDPGDLTLVLELVVGETLGSFVMRQDKRPEDRCVQSRGQSLRILSGICQAMIYLHTRVPVIVHGDLKPNNVMMERRGIGPFPKLLDFGLARTVTWNATQRGGTPNYISPEIIAEDNSRPSPSADVFALGRLIFFVLSQRTPLAMYSTKQIVMMSRRGQIPSLDWPRDFEMANIRSIVESCTSFSPKVRPTSTNLHDQLEYELDALQWSNSVTDINGLDFDLDAPPARQSCGGGSTNIKL